MEWIVLYCHIPPPGENILISIEPLPFNDLVPTEDDIEWSVQRLVSSRYGGPSGMISEHLHQCLREAWKE